jgi:hypothetical protein
VLAGSLASSLICYREDESEKVEVPQRINLGGPTKTSVIHRSKCGLMCRRISAEVLMKILLNLLQQHDSFGWLVKKQVVLYWKWKDICITVSYYVFNCPYEVCIHVARVSEVDFIASNLPGSEKARNKVHA